MFLIQRAGIMDTHEGRTKEELMNPHGNKNVRQADSRQQKKTAALGITAGIIAILAGCILAGVGLFCFLDAKVESGKSRLFDGVCPFGIWKFGYLSGSVSVGV